MKEARGDTCIPPKIKPIFPPFTHEFFDESSRAWRENKYSLPNGCFQYVVKPVLSESNDFYNLFD
jgi:hypothetical protein